MPVIPRKNPQTPSQYLIRTYPTANAPTTAKEMITMFIPTP